MFYFTDYICGIIIKRYLPNWGTHKNIFSFRRDQTGHWSLLMSTGVWGTMLCTGAHGLLYHSAFQWAWTLPTWSGREYYSLQMPTEHLLCPRHQSGHHDNTVSDLLGFQRTGGEKWVSRASSGIDKCAEGKKKVFQWVGQCGQRRARWGADSWVETWMIDKKEEQSKQKDEHKSQEQQGREGSGRGKEGCRGRIRVIEGVQWGQHWAGGSLWPHWAWRPQRRLWVWLGNNRKQRSDWRWVSCWILQRWTGPFKTMLCSAWGLEARMQTRHQKNHLLQYLARESEPENFIWNGIT